KAYHYGTDQALQEELFRWAADAARDPAHRREAARELTAVAASPAVFDARELACRSLVFVASESDVPALSALLSDKDLWHYGLMALARVPGKGVDDALLAALPRSQDRELMEIMDTLGDRG